MPKPKPNEIAEELKKQEDEQGEPDEVEVGVDVEEDLKRVIGNDPDEEKDGFSIAEEIDDDSEAAGNQPPPGEEETEEE